VFLWESRKLCHRQAPTKQYRKGDQKVRRKSKNEAKGWQYEMKSRARPAHHPTSKTTGMPRQTVWENATGHNKNQKNKESSRKRETTITIPATGNYTIAVLYCWCIPKRNIHQQKKTTRVVAYTEAENSFNFMM
jgi:hypothetical protein